MDKTTTAYSLLAQRIFGENARVSTSAGTKSGPGSVSILLGDRLIGEAESFQGALREAMREVSGQRRKNKPQPLTQTLTLADAFDQPAAAVG